MTKLRARFIECAINSAFNSRMFNRHGAILFRGKQIVHRAFNTHNDDEELGSSHAEYNLLSKKLKFKNYNLLVIRLDGSGNAITSSKPCAHCIAMLKNINKNKHRNKNIINKIYYSTKTGEVVCEKIHKLESTHLTKANRRKKK